MTSTPTPLPPPIATRLADIHALQDQLTSSPWSHDVIELAIAAAIGAPVSNQDDSAMVWLMVVGAPSADKTATILCIKGPKILHVDALTDNALSSGYVPAKGQQRKPDLLRQIEQSGAVCLVIKDMTTLFSLKDDRVKKLLGELQSIYDGEYAKATGTLGVLKYKTRFAIIGCITPLSLTKHHRYMSTIGSRFLFYRLPTLTEEERAEGFAITWKGSKERKAKLTELRDLAEMHVSALLVSPPGIVEITPEQQQLINRLAELLAHGRAATRWNKPQGGDWEIDQVQIEEPFRAAQQLGNLVRGPRPGAWAALYQQS